MPDHFSTLESEQFIDLITNEDLHTEFKEKECQLENFWLKIRNSHKDISDHALKILITFTTTNLREFSFSSLLYIKNKYRTRLLDLESNLRLKITKIEPNIKHLCEKKQSQIAH